MLTHFSVANFICMVDISEMQFLDFLRVKKKNEKT